MSKLLFLLLFLSGACVTPNAFSELEKEPTALTGILTTGPMFKARFDLELAGEEDLKVLALLQEQTVFKKISDFLSANLRLKADVLYSFIQGNEPLFGASQNQIFIPFNFLHQVYDDLRFKYPHQTDLSNKLFAFTIEKLLWQELGRVLISQYALPITGKEELSIDQFSTLVLLNLSEVDSEYILDATEEFLQIDDASTLISRLSFQSEAEFDEQRYRLVMCLVLGKDHENHGELLTELTWDQDRLLSCRAHYKEKMQSWHQALMPFLNAESSFSRWLERLPQVNMTSEAALLKNKYEGSMAE